VVDPAGAGVPAQVAGGELLVQARDVPGIGYRTFWVRAGAGAVPAGDLEVQGGGGGPVVLRNDPLWAEIDPATGALRSLLHLPTGREMLRRGEGGNVLQLLGDEPSQWDAWNIGYTGEEWGVEGPVEISVLERGPVRAVVRAVRRLGGSVLTQDYVLHGGASVLEVRTHARWDESRRFLKAAFHLAADADHATFEIPYGTIRRPTRPSTEAERAKWEVPGQRWADLTDRSGGWGVTLLNDSKYGHDLEGSRLRLSLLRAPKWPDPEADIGEHRFRYGLYPHAGDWRQARSYRRGAEFNVAMVPWVVSVPSDGPLAPESALVEADAGHVVLSAFKAARDPGARPLFVLRLHEAEGKEAEVTVRFPFPVEAAWSANLMEDRGDPLPVEGSTVRLPIGPHQLQTLLVEPAP
jgi:alpha-mannosidase